MAYDPVLAERLAKIIAGRPGMKEKRMFGGIVYMLNGNMCFGVHKNDLIVRISKNAAEKIFQEPHVKPMDITGKVMKGWAMIGPEGIAKDESLKRFCNYAIKSVLTLPAK